MQPQLENLKPKSIPHLPPPSIARSPAALITSPRPASLFPPFLPPSHIGRRRRRLASPAPGRRRRCAICAADRRSHIEDSRGSRRQPPPRVLPTVSAAIARVASLSTATADRAPPTGTTASPQPMADGSSTPVQIGGRQPGDRGTPIGLPHETWRGALPLLGHMYKSSTTLSQQ
ncbi:hypothetical protein DAI22_07g049200 [Oryza sativa Japonica Group]|nr:hypothetical protein DAI22_07g049200 [Oryza sativa Japonica Group]